MPEPRAKRKLVVVAQPTISLTVALLTAMLFALSTPGQVRGVASAGRVMPGLRSGTADKLGWLVPPGTDLPMVTSFTHSTVLIMTIIIPTMSQLSLQKKLFSLNLSKSPFL